MTLGTVYTYDNGQSAVEFCWNSKQRDGYAWSVARNQRLATYRRRRDVIAAYAASNNSQGAYGCAVLALGDDCHE